MDHYENARRAIELAVENARKEGRADYNAQAEEDAIGSAINHLNTRLAEILGPAPAVDPDRGMSVENDAEPQAEPQADWSSVR